MLAAPAAQAQKTETIQGGFTQVTFASGLGTTLTGLGVTVAPVGSAEHRKGVFNFASTTGAIDLDTGLFEILHTGGLAFTAGTNKVEFLNLLVDTSSGSTVVSGLVVANGTLVGRTPLFDLTLPTPALPLVPDRSVLQIEGIGIALDPAAATELNTALSTTGFTSGLDIGTANLTLLLPWTPKHGKK
jgi:hypothetical protein